MRHVIYILLVVNLVYFSWNMLRNMPHEGGAIHVRHIPTSVRQLETIQEKAAKSASDAPESARDTGGDAAVIAGPQEDENTVEPPETADIHRVGSLTASEPPGAVTPASSCYTLGPFRDEKELKAVENRLNQLGYEPRERTGDSRVESGYWVYLPAMEREEVLRITHILDENNDRDYLIVKDNALSLGVYDSRTWADVRLKTLHKYGFEPVVESRYATRSAYWLDLELLDGERAALGTIRSEYQNVEAQEAACQ